MSVVAGAGFENVLPVTSDDKCIDVQLVTNAGRFPSAETNEK